MPGALKIQTEQNAGFIIFNTETNWITFNQEETSFKSLIFYFHLRVIFWVWKNIK